MVTNNAINAENIQYTLIAGATTGYTSLGSTGSAGEVLTSNGAGALPSWQAAGGGGGLTWSVITAGTTNAVVNNGYIADTTAGKIFINLPTTFAIGDIIRVVGTGLTTWDINPGTGDIILSTDFKQTSPGPTGYLEATNSRDAVELVATVANAEWTIANDSTTGFIFH